MSRSETLAELTLQLSPCESPAIRTGRNEGQRALQLRLGGCRISAYHEERPVARDDGGICRTVNTRPARQRRERLAIERIRARHIRIRRARAGVRGHKPRE